MAYAWIIPIAVVAILGLSGYLVYRYVIFDILANNTVNNSQINMISQANQKGLNGSNDNSMFS